MPTFMEFWHTDEMILGTQQIEYIGVKECIFYSQNNLESMESCALVRKSGDFAGDLTYFFFQKVVVIAFAASIDK